MLGHRVFERGEPGGVRPFLREQLIAGPHRRFVASCMMRVARFERQHQPIEKAPPVASTAREQPIHGRRQPQDRQPLAERIDRRARAVDPHLPPLRRGDHGSCADIRLADTGRDGKRTAAALPRHFAERRAAQTATWRQQRHRLEQVCFACAILPEQEHETRPRLNQRRRVGAEIGEGEATDGHAGRLAFIVRGGRSLRNGRHARRNA